MDPARIELVGGDITRLAVDAIVNAANPALLGGGGVDGAIQRAAGPELRLACAAIAEVAPGVRCPPGQARITPGFRLPARHVIHVVGPIWRGGGNGEDQVLGDCYRNALALAREHGLRSIAFPAISCGAYGYPPGRAARVVVATLADEPAGSIERVLLVVADPSVERALSRELGAWRRGGA